MNVRLRILKCIADPRFGGPHRLSFAIAERLQAEGIETIFLFGPETDESGPACPFEHVHLRHLLFLRRRRPILNLLAFLLWLPWNILRIRKLIRSRRIDVVDVDGVLNVPPALTAWLCRVPVLWCYNDHLPGTVKLMLLPLVARLATRIVIQGECLRQARTASHPLLRQKAAVLHTGTDTTVFDPDRYDAEARRRVREQWHIPPGGPLIGIIGNLNPFKGHEDFLKAAARIKERTPDARFIVVGRRLTTAPGYWERLQQLTAALGLERDVIYTGFCDDIPSMLAALDVFVLASIRESCPNAVLEAMAMKVPVVATNVGAVSELVADGLTGTVVPPHDPEAIARAVVDHLAKTPEQVEAMTGAARRRVQTEFSLDRIARRQQELYATLDRRRAHRQNDHRRDAEND
ncbi:MAG TPA: glycosyltransferase family 4 protein [Sedimentisphaerales bacterium]|jgi:glycosyltransferase involved in cell wall biosynthesis|nr:glycosyltransferase family 4 protein [Sedimentisphaerales bacterium]HOC62026.1 glycosyltransferase family 4 protein [Sedimentisphaerales bacterium]HOH66083.1 glycosyltransferase family 4 protein [Sedimentisphaerales bacterium]HQA89297.1 glycosyltransferase family 4 protein [Sedimentisphaerales bacterium]HQN32720.1 glycosyltransferase family 4 protein [Sedimentisphaerales bacterium]